MTEKQVEAAKAALSGSPLPAPTAFIPPQGVSVVDKGENVTIDASKAQPGPAVREFNLDIAKLLLQFASIVYERRSGAIDGVLNEVSKHSKTQKHNGKWDQVRRRGRPIPTDGSDDAAKGGVAVKSATRWASTDSDVSSPQVAVDLDLMVSF